MSKTQSDKPGPTLLALDSATTGCSVCVWRAGQVLAAQSQPMARGQAQALMPMLDAVLDAAGLAPDAIDGVAVTRGPGAFTGLRIALSAARGFALALGVPCVGVTTLEAVAAAVPEDERTSGIGRKVLACVESKRDDIYVQLFSSDLAPLTDPLAAEGAALKGLFADGEQIVLVGDAAERAREMLDGADLDVVTSAADPLPDPAVVARLAAPRLNTAHGAPEPLYLRPPDAKLPKNQGRLRA